MPKKPCAHQGCARLVDIGTVYCEAHAVQDKKERDKFQLAKRSERPSRKWYGKAGWRGKNGRRLRQLAQEPLCRMCEEAGRVRAATIADHVIPHNDDYALFWYGALQSLCKPCHDIKKQREEKRTGRGRSKVHTPLN